MSRFFVTICVLVYLRVVSDERQNKYQIGTLTLRFQNKNHGFKTTIVEASRFINSSKQCRAIRSCSSATLEPL